jgi:tyrosinase
LLFTVVINFPGRFGEGVGKITDLGNFSARNRHALDGNPFQIHFFYGQPDSDVKPRDYFHADNLIGTYRIFTGPNNTMSRRKRLSSSVASSSADGDEGLSAGQISLSPVLAQAFANGLLPDDTFEPEDVVPTLSEQLNWRITDSAGEEVPVQTLTDKGQLRVAVVSRDVDPILEGEEHLFPQYGEWNHWQNATMGKLGAV